MKAIFALVGLVSLSACASPRFELPQAQLTPVQDSRAITPRTKGSTLELTPRTKGSTLLKGRVLWPDGSVISPTGFAITLLRDGEIISAVMSDQSGEFELPEAPEQGRLRIEARASHDPELILKRELELYREQLYAETQISLETTALVAVLDKSREMGSVLHQLPLRQLEDSVDRALEQVQQEMMPFLERDMQQSLEQMPTVKNAVDLAWAYLENRQERAQEIERPFVIP